MKSILKLTLLLTLVINLANANEQTLELDKKQIDEMIKTNTLYVIGVDDKYKWNKNKIKVRNFQTLKKGLLEYRFSKVDLDDFKKDTMFIISSKKKSTSLEFVKKLKDLGYKNVKYLKDGHKTWNEILLNFRGLKLFSLFKI